MRVVWMCGVFVDEWMWVFVVYVCAVRARVCVTCVCFCIAYACVPACISSPAVL